jgi:hypothetical protein
MMKRNIALAASVAASMSVAFAGPASAASATAYLGATADTYVDQSNSGSNFGADANLLVRSRNGNRDAKSILQFDLGTLPDDASIDSAELKLWMNTAPTASRTYDVYLCLNDPGTLEGATLDPVAAATTWANWTCADPILLSAGSDGAATGTTDASQLSWTGEAWKTHVQLQLNGQSTGEGDKKLTLMVQDRTLGVNWTSGNQLRATFDSKDSSSNPYDPDAVETVDEEEVNVADTTPHQPVLIIAYTQDNGNGECVGSDPVEIVEFTATEADPPGASATFDIVYSIRACQDLAAVQSQGGAIANTEVGGFELDDGELHTRRPGRSQNTIVTWTYPHGLLENETKTLKFTVTTIEDDKGKNICVDGQMKPVTGSWSTAVSWIDELGATQYYKTDKTGTPAVEISCPVE